jgi:hypothetical protein
MGTKPTHGQVPTPPDIWILVSNGDGICLPPPRDFSPYPATLPPQVPGSASPAPPLTNPPTVKPQNSQPILVVPPPASDTIHSRPSSRLEHSSSATSSVFVVRWPASDYSGRSSITKSLPANPALAELALKVHLLQCSIPSRQLSVTFEKVESTSPLKASSFFRRLVSNFRQSPGLICVGK